MIRPRLWSQWIALIEVQDRFHDIDHLIQSERFEQDTFRVQAVLSGFHD